MSTGSISSNSVTPPPPPAGPAKRSAKFIEYERFIDDQIQKTRWNVKSVEITSSLLILVAGGLLALLLISLFDHWVIPGGLGGWGRMVCFLMLVSGAIWYVVRSVVPLLLRRINPLYAAHTIEQTKPTFKNSLVSFLQFRQNRTQVVDAVYESVEQHAATSLTDAPVDAAVDRSALIRVGYLLLAVLTACAVYKAFSPKDPLTTLGRVLLPWADIAPSTRVTIGDIKPGDVVVPRGKQVTVSAEIVGVDDDEPVTLFYSTADGQVVDAAVMMTVPETGYRHECLLPPSKGRLQQDLSYRIEAGDHVTRHYQIAVEAAPTITVEAIEYDYPSYTQDDLLDRRDDRGGDIKAIEGTKVTIHAIANQEIARAHVDFDCNGKLGPRMIVDGNRARFTFTLRLAKTGATDEAPTPKHASYQLKFWNKDNHDNDQQVRHLIEVMADLPPEVELLRPQEPELRVAVNESIEMEVYAIDPDFQLSDVRITGQVNGAKALKEIRLLAASETPYRGKFQRRTTFVPRKFDLKVGDVVTYHPLAVDNKRPGPHRTLGQSRRLVIVAARPGSDRQPSPESADEQNPADVPNDSQQKSDDPQPDEEKPDSHDEGSDDQGMTDDEGSKEEGNKPEGNESQGNESQGNESQGNESQGNESQGNESQGNESEGAGDQGESQSHQRPGDKGQDAPEGQTGTESSPEDGLSEEGADRSEAISELLQDQKEMEQGKGGKGKEESSQDESSQDESSQDGRPDDGRPDDGRPDDGRPDDGQSKDADDPADKGRGMSGGAEDRTDGEQGADAEPYPNKQTTDDSTEPGKQDDPGMGDPGRSGKGKPSDDETGSPDAQGDNQTRKNDQPEQDDPGNPSQEGAKSPSNSKQQSKDSTGEGGNRSGGGEQGGGQNADQAGRDTAGSHQASDEGAGAAEEPGKGEVGEKAGRGAESNSKTGESGKTKGNGSESQSSDGKTGDQPNDTQPSENPDAQPVDGKTPERPASDGNPSRSEGNGQSSSEPGASDGKPGEQTDPSGREYQELAGDDANLEYTKKATDLALEHLRDLMENDPERLKTILKKLNRDEAWMQKMMEETERDRRDADGVGEAAKNARQKLRNLGLRDRTTGPRRMDASSDGVSRLNQGAATKAPEAYAKRARAYRKRAAQESARNRNQP